MRLRFNFQAVPCPVDNDQRAYGTIDVDPELVQRFTTTWDELTKLGTRIFAGKDANIEIAPGMATFYEHLRHVGSPTPGGPRT